MNKEAEEELQRILALDPSVLNTSEIQFLKARISYLTTDQKRIFASVLETEKESKKK
jgi:hypothetical protein